MTGLWAPILVAAAGCYGLKLAGVSLPDSFLADARVQRAAGLLPVAMLSALVATDLFDHGGRYGADWHMLVGVGAGAVALWLHRSLLVVLLVAIGVTAALHALA
jgi:branched chain amino acid efflux pump